MERVLIHIHGIVQGVGFRPFIHKQVRAYRLAGTIKNTSSGVELELEGEREELERFLADLPHKAPKLAVIEKIESEFFTELKHFTDFRILQSKTEDQRNTLISPDIGICSSPPISASARTACASCSTLPTGATAIPLSTVPTAAPALRSSRTCPMTGPRPR